MVVSVAVLFSSLAAVELAVSVDELAATVELDVADVDRVGDDGPWLLFNREWNKRYHSFGSAPICSHM